jgi:hypothetical protein
MAGTSRTVLAEFHTDSQIDVMREQINKLVDDLEALRAAYVLHQHSALNAAPSTQTVAAATLTAAKVLTHSPTQS